MLEQPNLSFRINTLNPLTHHTEFITGCPTLKTTNCTILMARAETAEFWATYLKPDQRKKKEGN